MRRFTEKMRRACGEGGITAAEAASLQSKASLRWLIQMQALASFDCVAHLPWRAVPGKNAAPLRMPGERGAVKGAAGRAER